MICYKNTLVKTKVKRKYQIKVLKFLLHVDVSVFAAYKPEVALNAFPFAAFYRGMFE